MGYTSDKLRWVACGGPFRPVSQTYLCGLDPSRGRDTHIGLDCKRPKRGSGGNASPTGFICVCGPGLVGKSLLHRVDIKSCTVDIIRCPPWGMIHPIVGPARVSTVGSRSLGSSGYT